MIALIAVVALGLIYGGWYLVSGGMSTGDIPESGLSTASAPPATTPPPAAAPPAGAGGAPQAPGAPAGGDGSTRFAGVGAGGATPPAGGGAAPPVGGGAAPGGGSAAPPAGGGGAAAPGGTPAGAPGAAAMTPQEKDTALKAFEKIDSHDIMISRQEEAKKSESEVNAEKELPYPDTGRTDPLFINNQAIPEELRPPRTGESDYDSILDFLITAYGTEMLDQVQIEVWSVMQIGLEKYVNMSINGMLATVPEGSGGQLPNGVGITVSSASQTEVVIVLSFSTAYSSVSKTKSYIPKET